MFLNEDTPEITITNPPMSLLIRKRQYRNIFVIDIHTKYNTTLNFQLIKSYDIGIDQVFFLLLRKYKKINMVLLSQLFVHIQQIILMTGSSPICTLCYNYLVCRKKILTYINSASS